MPLPAKHCQCGFTFAELGEAAMRRMQEQEAEELEARLRERAGLGPLSPESEAGSQKIEMERRASSSSRRE